MIAHKGISILYGVVRGTVADATATGWNGKFVLLTVNFVELVKQKAGVVEKGQKLVRKGKKIVYRLRLEPLIGNDRWFLTMDAWDLAGLN